MRTTVITRCIAFALVATVTLSSAAAAARVAPSPHPTVTTKVEPHPEINRAIAALVRARAHLQRAAHDFGGHRVAAIAAIDAALEQLKLALQYDKH